MYARGSADDKGNFLPLLHVACELARAGELPVNVRFLVEGEEEVGSPSVLKRLRTGEDDADCAIVFDSLMVDERTPAITLARAASCRRRRGAHRPARPALRALRRRGAQRGPRAAWRCSRRSRRRAGARAPGAAAGVAPRRRSASPGSGCPPGERDRGRGRRPVRRTPAPSSTSASAPPRRVDVNMIRSASRARSSRRWRAGT